MAHYYDVYVIVNNSTLIIIIIYDHEFFYDNVFIYPIHKCYDCVYDIKCIRRSEVIDFIDGSLKNICWNEDEDKLDIELHEQIKQLYSGIKF